MPPANNNWTPYSRFDCCLIRLRLTGMRTQCDNSFHRELIVSLYRWPFKLLKKKGVMRLF